MDVTIKFSTRSPYQEFLKRMPRPTAVFHIVSDITYDSNIYLRVETNDTVMYSIVDHFRRQYGGELAEHLAAW